MNIITTGFNQKIQAQIFVGNPNQTVNYTKNFLNNIFNNNNNNILWLQPEKQYTLEQIDIVFYKISFSLDHNQYFFIIFQQAELLNNACSNRLLKPLEEPPRGYYFIFLTNREKSILPTIRSRCHIKYFYDQYNSIEMSKLSDLEKFFITSNGLDPILFLKTLDKSDINEHSTIDILDSLIKYWIIKSRENLVNNKLQEYKKSCNILKILTNALNKLPMPGSTNIFWKDIFLALSRI